ncbi:MAG: 4Fe-4S binding protein [Candidatus Thermoplasmatota archaeon]
MKQYEKTGVLKKSDLLNLPSEKQLKKGVAVIECIQRIPCNPCVDVCPVDAISMKDINAPPVIDYDKCIGCKKCVGICPGLAIFVIKTQGDRADVTLPYEFLPVPEKNEGVDVLDREGKKIGEGVVKKVVSSGKTFVVTVEVDKKKAMDVRNIRV